MPWWNVFRKPRQVPPPPPASGHPSRSPESDFEGYVSQLQKDGRLLLRFIARRTDRIVPTSLIDQARPQGDAGPPAQGERALLLGDCAAIARDARQFAALVNLVDDLSMRAAPATTGTLRLTYAYLDIPAEGQEPPDEFKSHAAVLRRSMQALVAWSVLAFLLTVAMLIHLTEGQNALKQLTQQRNVHDGFVSQLALIAAQATRPLDTICSASESQGGAQRKTGNQDSTGSATQPAVIWQATDICGRKTNVEREMAITYAKITDWNCITAAMAPWIPNYTRCAYWDRRPAQAMSWQDLSWLDMEKVASPIPRFHGSRWAAIKALLIDDRGVLDAEDRATQIWDSTEIRSQIYMSSLAGFVTPMMVGMLGGCIYALRRFDAKLTHCTLERGDAIRSWLRVLMAAIMGGLLGVIWTSDQPVHLGSFSLSLTALAFFVGFSLEVVFTVIEAMVDSVATRMRNWTPDPGFLMATQQRPPIAPPTGPPVGGGEQHPSGHQKKRDDGGTSAPTHQG